MYCASHSCWLNYPAMNIVFVFLLSFPVAAEFQDSSAFMMYTYPDTSRLPKAAYTPLPPRTSEPKIISAKMGNRR